MNVARVMGVTRNTVYNWLACYRAGGWHRLKDGKKSGRPRKLNAKVMKWLYDAITLGNPYQQKFDFALWSLRVVRAMLYKKFGIKLSKSSLSRLLRQMGLSAQKPVYAAYNQDPGAARRWKERHYPRIRNVANKLGWKIFFIDESALRSDYHRGTTWGKRGQTPVAGEHRGRYGINLMSAVNARGQLWFGSYEGRMNSGQFIGFLEKMLTDIGEKLLLVVDQASYHASKQTREFVRANKDKLRLFKLPKYSPELNPDEQVWNRAKAILGKKIISNKKEMKQKAIEVMRKLQKKTKLIISFFKLPDTKYILT